MSTAIIITICIWIALSFLPLLLANSRHLKTLIRLDPLFLLSHWRMYVKGAPGLEQLDYFIRYRDVEKDGTITEWRLLEPAGRKWYHFIWHPALSRKILIYHYTQFLVMELKKMSAANSKAVELYKIITHNVLDQPRLSERSIEREFELVVYNLESNEIDQERTLQSKRYAT